MPATYLALLRGINVGGKNGLPMKDLIAMFVEAGCENVRTYIQSGNVAFDAGPADAGRVPGLVSGAVAGRFGYRTPVILRTAAELGRVVANNPFVGAGAPGDELHLMFLADEPEPGRVAALDPDRSPPDAFAVRGRDVYLRLPNGVARSRLTNAYFDSKLGTTGTARNWRTVTRLLEFMAG